MENFPQFTSDEDVTGFNEQPAFEGFVQTEDDQPKELKPLAEELGIDFDLIRRKMKAVLIPRAYIEHEILHDTDMGGPFIFSLVLGLILLLSGRVYFGYIFGYYFLGGFFMGGLLNLMSDEGMSSTYHTWSILGYCNLPMIFLAILCLIVDPASYIGLIFMVLTISYSTHMAASMFEQVLQMKEQYYLLAYPISLLYTCFALIVMF